MTPSTFLCGLLLGRWPGLPLRSLLLLARDSCTERPRWPGCSLVRNLGLPGSPSWAGEQGVQGVLDVDLLRARLLGVQDVMRGPAFYALVCRISWGDSGTAIRACRQSQTKQDRSPVGPPLRIGPIDLLRRRDQHSPRTVAAYSRYSDKSNACHGLRFGSSRE